MGCERREYKSYPMISDCWFCSNSRLYPDGALRCGNTIARELCDSYSPGHSTIFKSEPQPKQTFT